MDVTRIPYNTKYHTAFRKICGEDPSESAGHYERFADTYIRYEHAMIAASAPAPTHVRGMGFPHSVRSGSIVKYDNLQNFKTWMKDNCPKGPPTAPVGDRKPVENGAQDQVKIGPNRSALSPQTARSLTFTTIMGGAAAAFWWLIRKSPPGLALEGVSVFLEAGKGYKLDMKISSREPI